MGVEFVGFEGGGYGNVFGLELLEQWRDIGVVIDDVFGDVVA